MSFYAGIGSRKTPSAICSLMEKIAYKLATLDYCLRHGDADGADKAFDRGCDRANGRKEIYKPMGGFKMHEEAHSIAAKIHPNWEACNPFARACHTRNVYIVLGQDLQSPVEFVVCWTPDGAKVGGTRTGIVLAEQRGIQVYNIAIDRDLQALRERFGSKS